jgi:hypothetical protein
LTILRRRQKRYAERLGGVVQSLPYETQRAMLAGLRRYDRIIAGAYTDRQGGVCPMLAAHRNGGRTDFRSFARAWDRFTGARVARPVTKRELRTLCAQLDSAIWQEEQRRELARVARASAERMERERLQARRPRRPRRTSSWLGPFRRWDRYRATVARAFGELERAGVLDASNDSPSPNEVRKFERV